MRLSRKEANERLEALMREYARVVLENAILKARFNVK
jgi:hypothetical protein